MPYHLSPNGPQLCHAKQGGCPYARAGEPHFDNVADANVAYEKKMAEAFGDFDTHRKTLKQRIKEKTAYALRDTFVKAAGAVVASKPIQATVRAVRYVKETPARIESSITRAANEIWRNLSTGLAQIDQTFEAAQARMRYEAFVAMERNRAFQEQQRVQAQYQFELAQWRHQMDSYYGKERHVAANKLRAGDVLETPTGRVKVHSIRTVDGTTTIQTRDAVTGQFRKSEKISSGTSIALRRQPRNEVRGVLRDRVASGYRRAQERAGSYVEKTKNVWGVASDRVHVAASKQREVFDTLLGIDRTVHARHALPRTAISGIPRFHGGRSNLGLAA